MLHRANAEATTNKLRANSSAPIPSVVHIASGDLWGGAEALVAELAREQHAAAPGQVACVVMNPGILATELINSGIRTLVLDESRSNVFKLATQTAQLVRDLRPDILHAHRQKENLIALLATWLRSTGVQRPRLVSTIHGLPEPVAANRGWRRRMVAAFNERILRTGFDAIVAVSRDIERTFRARFPAERIVCVHNGIRVPQSARRAQRTRRAHSNYWRWGAWCPSSDTTGFGMSRTPSPRRQVAAPLFVSRVRVRCSVSSKPCCGPRMRRRDSRCPDSFATWVACSMIAMRC